MSAKMERLLKSDKPRVKNIGFRVTDEQFEMLEECIRLTGKSKTDIIALGLEKVYQELKG